jgi:hypothetical protein
MVQRFGQVEITLAYRMVLLVKGDAWGVNGSNALIEKAVEVEAYCGHEFLGYSDDHDIQSSQLVLVDFRYPADRSRDADDKGVLPHPYRFEVDLYGEITVYAKQRQVAVEAAGFLHESPHALFITLFRNEEGIGEILVVLGGEYPSQTPYVQFVK